MGCKKMRFDFWWDCLSVGCLLFGLTKVLENDLKRAVPCSSILEGGDKRVSLSEMFYQTFRESERGWLGQGCQETVQCMARQEPRALREL